MVYSRLMRLDPDTCYDALLSRNRRFDGWFFVGVATTGVYCRPVCPVKPPKVQNCSYYPSAAAAEKAGFRPCMRCRPARPATGCSTCPARSPTRPPR